MKLGTEDKKKTALAAGLTAVALGTVYVQFFAGSAPPAARPAPAARRPAATPAGVPTIAAGPEARAPRRAAAPAVRRRAAGQRFEPIWRRFRDDETFDPVEADPTLRTDLLAAVRKVPMGPVGRDIFRFGERRVALPPPDPAMVAEAQRRQEAFAAAAAAPPPPPAPAVPPERRAPRITWRYYGFAASGPDGERRAFLLDGEDLLIGGEGDVFRNRYKIVRVGLTSVVVEDLEYNDRQTLPLTPRG